MHLEVETGLTIIVFPKLAEAAGNARGVPNGGVRSRSAISGKMCISPRCMIHCVVVCATTGRVVTGGAAGVRLGRARRREYRIF